MFNDLVKVDATTVNAKSAPDKCLVLDTSDAKEGVVIGGKPIKSGSELGSMKKLIVEHDVIISRLRPYLRQVALVDGDLPNWGKNVALTCSTEFFVLRSPDAQSIAFLVPYLLSEPVQRVLAASQEGGHHPRFSESALLSLPIPIEIVERRDALSREVEHGVRLYRESERIMAQVISDMSSLLEGILAPAI